MHLAEHGARVEVVVDLDVGLDVVGAQDPSEVLHDPALEREREREEQGVETGAVEPFAEEPVARSSCPVGAGSALSWSITAARAFVPRPPLSTSGSTPRWWSWVARASRWSVH